MCTLHRWVSCFFVKLKKAKQIIFAFDSDDPVILKFDPPDEKVDEFKNLIHEEMLLESTSTSRVVNNG